MSNLNIEIHLSFYFKQFRTYPHSNGKVANVYLLSEARYAKTGNNDDYIKRISGTPDKKFFLNMDLTSVDDPEFHNHELYPINGSSSQWTASVMNDIKFHMPSIPPLYNWDQLDKVIFFLNRLFLKN